MSMITRDRDVTLTGRAGRWLALVPRSSLPWPWRIVIALILVLLIIPAGLIAVGSGLGLVPLPYEMFLLAERMPLIFKIHMVTGAIVLLLAPAVVAARNDRRTHRMLGRVLGAFVVMAGLSAFPVAIISSSSLAARAGFFVQGLVWLTLFAAAIAAIRNGRRWQHIRLMLAMVAVTTGAVWFRVLTGSAILLDLPFAETYAIAAWAGWMVPLALVLSIDAIPRAFAR